MSWKKSGAAWPGYPICFPFLALSSSCCLQFLALRGDKTAPISLGFKPISLSPKGPRKRLFLFIDSDKSHPSLIMMTRQMQWSSWPGLNHMLISDIKEEISKLCRSEVWKGSHWVKISVRRVVFFWKLHRKTCYPLFSSCWRWPVHL